MEQEWQDAIRRFATLEFADHPNRARQETATP